MALTALAALCCRAGLAGAQTTGSPDLVRLVPDDFGFILTVNDLRGHHERLERSAWLRAFRETPPGRVLFAAPELKDLRRLEAALPKLLGVDWPTLRDDVLGGEVVLAYRPAASGAPEEGLVLVRARKPEPLAAVVAAVNRAQQQSGELKAVTAVRHLGTTYHRRDHVQNTHYYYLSETLLIVAGTEPLLRQVIEARQRGAASAWPGRFSRAGADRAFASLCVNPRAFDAEVLKDADKAPALAALWKAADAAFVTAHASDHVELRVTVQGRAPEMPAWAAPLFRETPAASSVWQRFPESAVLTVAARNDFAALADRLLELMPEAERKKTVGDVRKLMAGLASLDFFADVLPSVGPDWGVCVLPPGPDDPHPQVIAAVAVQPGGKAEKVDEIVLKGIHIGVSLALLEHNRTKPPIRQQTLRQGAVEVRYLESEKALPRGIRPAWALKDGFLVVATSPDLILRFAEGAGPKAEGGETPLLRVSAAGVLAVLDRRRQQVIDDLRRKQQVSAEEAAQRFDALTSALGLFDRLTLSQRSEPGQASWSLRLFASPGLSRRTSD